MTVAAELAKTQFGLPIDESFAKPVSEERLQKAAAALRAHGFAVEIVNTPADAKAYVTSILPKGQTILTVSSETVRLSGLDEEINRSGKYDAIRPKMEKLDRNTQWKEMRTLAGAPDVVVGSVQAVTEDGRIMMASASGSQLGPYAASAGKVIWVVGSQKVVSNLDAGKDRIQFYAYPKEDIRAREKYGFPSAIMKLMTINGERPGRITIVLIRESIGY